MELPEEFMVIQDEAPVDYGEFDFCVNKMFDIAGYETAISLQSLFDGDTRAYVPWFFAPRSALGNISPAEACLDGKRRLVNSLIGRIEHGVFS